MRTYVIAALIALAGGLAAGAALFHPAEPAPSVVEVDRDRGGSVWGDNYFPNIPLTSHEGEQVRFFDDLIEGKVVLVNFIYTACPDTCPTETARMLQVARLLGDRLGEDVFFHSITVDPERDTQPVLAEFAESWNIPEGWTFYTGDERDIVRLRKKLGMRLDDVASGDLADHTVNLLIGNQATGRWMKRSPFENPYVLADQLGSWLHGWKAPRDNDLDYEDAPELRQISDGEYIFRNMCSSCHTIGGGDVARDEHRIGPDLLHVTEQRDRAWLERWLMEPDKMLEEKDPLAVALYEQYDRVPMPNLRLTEVDVDDLIRYMEEESARVQRYVDGSRRMADQGDHEGHEGHAMSSEIHGEEHADHGDHGASHEGL